MSKKVLEQFIDKAIRNNKRNLGNLYYNLCQKYAVVSFYYEKPKVEIYVQRTEQCQIVYTM